MSIKMIALAAATVAATASMAQADNYFSFGEVLDGTHSFDLGTVRAAADGVIEIYNYAGGQQGALIGSTSVNAGANQDVRVQVTPSAYSDVLAVLKVNGQVVATKDYDIAK